MTYCLIQAKLDGLVDQFGLNFDLVQVGFHNCYLVLHSGFFRAEVVQLKLLHLILSEA